MPLARKAQFNEVENRQMTVLCKAYRMDLQSLCGLELWVDQVQKTRQTEMYVSTFSIFCFRFGFESFMNKIILSFSASYP